MVQKQKPKKSKIQIKDLSSSSKKGVKERILYFILPLGIALGLKFKAKGRGKGKTSFKIKNMMMSFVLGSLFGIACTLFFISLFGKDSAEYSSPSAIMEADFTLKEDKAKQVPSFIPEEPLDEIATVHKEEEPIAQTPKEAPPPIPYPAEKVDVIPLLPPEEKPQVLTEDVLGTQSEETDKEQTNIIPELLPQTVPEKPAELAPKEPSQGQEVEEEKLPSSHNIKPRNWEKYALNVDGIPKDAPLIAIIIDDLGIDRKRTSKIIKLPAPITASFITYAGKLEKQIKEAVKHKKEIMLHIPMEPSRKSIDSGPNTITVDMQESEIKDILTSQMKDEILNLGVVGVNNHMGSRLTKDKKAMRAFMEAFAPYDLLFIDSRTARGSVALDIATELGITAGGRDVFLDNKEDVPYIKKQLGQLERVAKKKGYAIGIAHPHDATITALSDWIETATDKGFYIVPISYLIKERLKQSQN